MNTVKCPKCGKENLSTNIRCENCGTQLINEEQLNSLRDTQLNTIQEAKGDSSIEIFSGIGVTISGAGFSGFSSMIVFQGADIFTKIIGIPFLVCGLAILIFGISMLVKGIKTKIDYVNGELTKDKVEKNEKNLDKVNRIVNFIYLFGFLLFWFGFLIVLDTVAIQSWADGGRSMFFFSLIFWAVGIYIVYLYINKKMRKNKNQ